MLQILMMKTLFGVLGAGAGLQVHASRPSAPGSPYPFTQEIRQCLVFLLGVAADSIARQKLAAWPGVAAYLACGFCLFQGQKFDGSPAMRFAGYSQPAPQVILQLGDRRVGDAELQLSDQDQRDRAAMVDEYHAGTGHGCEPRLAGCNGSSILVQPLAYVSYNDLFQLPLYHAASRRATVKLSLSWYCLCMTHVMSQHSSMQLPAAHCIWHVRRQHSALYSNNAAGHSNDIQHVILSHLQAGARTVS